MASTVRSLGVALLALGACLLTPARLQADMRAIYDEATGDLRFEGLDNIHGVTVWRLGESALYGDAISQVGTMRETLDDSIAWLFLDGIENGAFDAGRITPAGLSAELTQYFVGVVSIGSGLPVTAIPIVSGSGSYLPKMNPYDVPVAPPFVEPAPLPVIGEPPQPVIPPPINQPPSFVDLPPIDPPSPPVIDLPGTSTVPFDPTGMRAIYDDLTGDIRFEGLDNVHGVTVWRSGESTLYGEAMNHLGTLDEALDDSVSWLFLDGIENGAFDAGRIAPAGLSDELGQYYVGVVSMGSGQPYPTAIPIETSTGVYLPSFNPYEALAPVPGPEIVVVEPPVAPDYPTVELPPVVEQPPVVEPPPVVEQPPMEFPGRGGWIDPVYSPPDEAHWIDNGITILPYPIRWESIDGVVDWTERYFIDSLPYGDGGYIVLRAVTADDGTIDADLDQQVLVTALGTTEMTLVLAASGGSGQTVAGLKGVIANSASNGVAFLGAAAAFGNGATADSSQIPEPSGLALAAVALILAARGRRRSA